ncbi:acyl-CoA dehydrogenase family protein [Nocardia sp. NPDC052278]|uniref:acyl-CoA dehydrogenase family protein n=1 Tax=unclassified Nocardia TaxID=2637762 RepID=UPI0036D074F5
MSEEQVALQEMAGDFFASKPGIEAARIALDQGIDGLPDLRADLAKLGVLGILAVEERGGTVLDLAVVAEQAGRTVATSPLVGTSARAVPLLEAAGTPEALELLTAVLSGTVAVAVADGPGIHCTADSSVHGTSAPVLDGAVADTILVLTEHAGEPVLVSVEAGGDIARSPRHHLDPTRRLATLEFRGAPAVTLASGDHATRAWQRATDIATVVLAAEDLGATSECVRRAVEYAKQRQAFGRTIGSFQALKHALVEAYVAEEQLRSLVWLAAWSADAEPENLALYASAAAAYAGAALEQAADTLIHTHGGIGFTWEHDAHLFWRRGKVDRLLLGDVHDHQARVAEIQLTA